MSKLTEKELQELEDLAKELEQLEFEVGGEDEDADAVLARWREYRKQEGYDDDDDSEEEDDDPHKYDGRMADPILEKSVDQLLEEDRRRWEEQERAWQEQERQRQEAYQQQQLLWAQQDEALASGTYDFNNYGAFGYGGDMTQGGGYADYGYGGEQEDFYQDYYAYTYDIDMSEFDTEEYIRLYQEALSLLEAQQKALEEEEERHKKLADAKKAAEREAAKKKKAEEAAAAGQAEDEDSSEPEDSDEDVDDEEIMKRVQENKAKKEAELKKLADQRAKVMLLGRAGKLPEDKKKKPKKERTGKVQASASSGLKVDAKTGKLKVMQGGEKIKINLKDAVAIRDMDGNTGCVIVMPGGFELSIKSRSRLAPRLKEVRDALLAADKK